MPIIQDKIKEELQKRKGISGVEVELEKMKTKTELANLLKSYKEIVQEIILKNNIRIKDYQEDGQMNKLLEVIVQEVAGYDILSDAFYDDEISDIFCLQWNKIYVEKKGENLLYGKTFRDANHYKNFINRILGHAGKEVNDGDKKIVDFELYGDRGCAIAKAIAPKDLSLTMRKHSDDHITKNDLITKNVMTEEVADLIGTTILGECNVVYAGITGTGKTTTIRALLDYYVAKANKRMMVCEDTQELFPKNDHTLELVSFKNEDKSLEVSLNSLVLAALRLKPKYIVVGEVRGEEAVAAVEAGETGHSTIFTMHGGTPANVVNRFVTKYAMGMPSLSSEIVERIIGNSIDYVGIQANIPGIGRRCISYSEISYNWEQKRIVIKPIVKFDIRTQEFKWVGKISMEKADHMMQRGVPWKDLEKWTEDEKQVS